MMQLTIDEILNLTVIEEYDYYMPFNEFEVFQPLNGMDVSEIDMTTTKNLKEKSYVLDLCNDGQARQLNVISYLDNPFVVYQYTGKGDVVNEAIIDEDIYKEFIQDYISEFLTKPKIKVFSGKDMYEIRNYDKGYFLIGNNTLVSKNAASKQIIHS
ncbi:MULTISPECIES: hypothetical protein [Bacillus cereus group]|uniref:Uncharacterized protein n=1 Tax=Bacillus thuringiensis TaxID=1428 RepID=A0A9X6WHT9_BACTU|nr:MULTISPECIES: hypothetical protein [Bacillus cereus group]PFJ28940.1 hypothetical protein COJ15_32235 [Bacillus thuringiensis]PGP14542.1 hypothetical protein COA01_29710 [Bacillus cereus]